MSQGAKSPLHALLRLARVATAASPSAPTVSRAAKLREWVHRYGVAECGGVAGALVGSYLVRHITRNAIAAAYGGAWGETLGYAAVIFVRDLVSESRTARSERGRFHFGDIGRVIVGLLVEFGPAGALDTLVTRPAAMAIGTRAFGMPLGVVVGKLVADVLFYIPVIIMYERRKGKAP